MRAASLLLLVLGILPSIQAQAYDPWCSRGYRVDSYGRGIEAGFRSIDVRPNLADPFCYDLGIQRGKSLMTQPVIFDCEGDFDDAYQEGLKASSLSAGTACYNSGYLAGLSALRVGAREGRTDIAGQECVEQYQRGKKDGTESKIAERPIGEPDATCYLAGHFDGGLFR